MARRGGGYGDGIPAQFAWGAGGPPAQYGGGGGGTHGWAAAVTGDGLVGVAATTWASVGRRWEHSARYDRR